MQWEELLGHATQRAWFQTALTNRRLATSFLFVGPHGTGKRTFARLLAQSLLCRATDPNQLSHCGTCEDCVQVQADTHPDLLQVSKPADKAAIPVELLIGERDKRMREGLCHDISLRPYAGRRKIAILDDADHLNVEGANCLLKTLEEPPIDSLLILIGSSLQRQLPTIRSRCQSILFRPLSQEQLSQLLERQEWISSPAEAAELAAHSDGSLTAARALADPELREFRDGLLAALSQPMLAFGDLAKQCGTIVDAAGKDGRAKRDRLKTLFGFAAAFYRGLTLQLDAAQNLSSGDPLLESSVSQAAGHWKPGSPGAMACWRRCLLAIEQVDRNANQTGLLEAWSTDLATLSRC